MSMAFDVKVEKKYGTAALVRVSPGRGQALMAQFDRDEESGAWKPPKVYVVNPNERKATIGIPPEPRCFSLSSLKELGQEVQLLHVLLLHLKKQLEEGNELHTGWFYENDITPLAQEVGV